MGWALKNSSNPTSNKRPLYGYEKLLSTHILEKKKAVYLLAYNLDIHHQQFILTIFCYLLFCCKINLLLTEGGEGGEGGGERGERVKKGEIEWAPSLAKAPALNVKYLNNQPGHSIE